ncbi:hypothetical protein FWK35_00000821 [Aphis craccivora]|uniref:Uncharacterized protein n=1 Tax=Aphis craccivora TaxID=307492 RepID=A0A6G0ZK58_APHCR|nr:hypothetical protein FWK35_00000821 [Aphis craccivora]
MKKIVHMYSYNFLIAIRKTYEELCMKFSSIYDLYFLNNNIYLKSFEDKSLLLRYFLKI